jgi:hypothetical protein
MRIAVPQGAKVYPLDRNPSNILRIHSQQLTGPVAVTTVWTYTVPAGRAFLCGLVYMRQTVVAPATLVHYANLWLYIAGQVAFTSFMIEDASGNQDRQHIPVNVNFMPGVSFSAQREIQSTATVWQEIGMIGLEYDR